MKLADLTGPGPSLAVKCNPDPYVLHLFAKLGLGFDCASHAEIALVLGLGVSASNIIYANPCKAGSFVRHAHASGVQMMTFDNADELHKVAQHHPSAKMVLRILTDDRGSVCRFGEKFGAPAAEVPSLLETARSLGVDVIGVAFHVGSGCSNPALYKDALERAKWVFEIATQFGFNLELVDVGGGFGNDNFEILAEGLLAGLNEYFPIGCGVRVIAEPGRYFVTEAFELATNIIARRQLSVPKGLTDVSMPDAVESEDAPVTMCKQLHLCPAHAIILETTSNIPILVSDYINDGVYGAFNCIIFDHKVVHPKVLTLDGKFASEPVFSPRSDEAKLESFTPPLSLECSVASLDSLSSSTPEEKEHMSFASLELQPCKIFGPSCDSIDLVCPLAHLPTKALKVGDWLRWTDMGAYSVCAASQFNGFKISQVRYTIDAKGHPTLENELREILGRVY